MNTALTETYSRNGNLDDFKRLPTKFRRQAAERKYAKAVDLYASTSLSIRQVAEECGVTASGLSAHIAKHHRDLLFARYGLDSKDKDLYSIKVKPPKGQSLKTHLKYKDAIEACGDVAYIEYNVSQVGHLFHVNGSALAAQMRVHYPDIIPAREKLRQRLGIADNTWRGPRQWCVEAYGPAMEMYRDSDLTIQKVAEICNVSKSGFSQYLRFYHHDVIDEKSARRRAASKNAAMRKPGKLSGNGQTYGPKPDTIALYAPALDLYRSSTLTIKEIAAKTGVPLTGLKGYLHKWHQCGRPRGLRTAAKYAPAIASLRENPRPVAEVAAQFGLNPEVFREYLKAHEPGLATQQGMARQPDGRLVKRSSSEKYAEAIREYATSAEPLKSIAQRHGLVYNSLLAFIQRNCPEARESHRKLEMEL